MSYGIQEHREKICTLIFGHSHCRFQNPKKGISKVYTKWILIFNFFNSKIEEKAEDYPTLQKFTSELKFKNFLNGTSGNSESPKFWREYLELAEEIASEINSQYLSSEKNKGKSTKQNNKPINFLYYPFPDTGLPFYFKYGLSNGLDIRFKQATSWEITKNSLRKKESDIILHSFSKAVAIDKLLTNEDIIFYPLFSFNGYGLVLNKKLIKKDRKQSMENYLLSEEWDKILLKQSNKIVVEKNTDLQWMVKKYLEKQQIELSDDQFHDKITQYKNLRIKNYFRKPNILMASTNWMNFQHFEESKDEFHVIKSTQHFQHANLNGLIFTKKYFNENKNKIRKIISNWYDSIRIFNEELSSINLTEEIEDINLNTHLGTYISFLRKRRSTKKDIVFFAKNIKRHNVFIDYKDEKKFKNVESSIENYLELSNVNYSRFKKTDKEKIEIHDIQRVLKNSKKIINELR